MGAWLVDDEDDDDDAEWKNGEVDEFGLCGGIQELSSHVFSRFVFFEDDDSEFWDFERTGSWFFGYPNISFQLHEHTRNLFDISILSQL